MERVAYRQMEPGNPSSLVQVKEELPSPGSGEVLMRIRATSLNSRDVMMLSGRLPSPVKAGVVPLSDAAGEIIEVGPGTTRFSVGDRVINSFYATWIGGPLRNRPVPYATTIDGWLATHRVVPAEALSRMPAHLSFEEAATLPCAGVTAWSALSGIDAGDTVLTQGSGGVSLLAIQLASRSGARVIATTTSARKAERLKVLGAWEVIDVGASPEWAKPSRALRRARAPTGSSRSAARERWRNRSGPSHITVRCPSSVR